MYKPGMEDALIKIQEILSHQSEDIARMSDELYKQQREIIELREELAKLKSKMEVAEQPSFFSMLNEKPPHY